MNDLDGIDLGDIDEPSQKQEPQVQKVIVRTKENSISLEQQKAVVEQENEKNDVSKEVADFLKTD